MRDVLGVLLVAVGLSWTVLLRDKLGLVIALAGVNLLAYDVLGPVVTVNPARAFSFIIGSTTVQRYD